MNAICIEKLERRQVAAADLIAASEMSVWNDSSPAAEQSASIGKFCAAADVSTSSTSSSVSSPLVALPSTAIFERTSTDNLALDVNRDGYISPGDADLIVANINGDKLVGPMQPQQAEGEDTHAQSFDVNSDGIVSAADVLTVMNRVHFYNSLVPCNCAACLASAVTEGV